MTTILWSFAGATSLLLGLGHVLVWVHDRHARANLTFALVALSIAGLAVAELGIFPMALAPAAVLILVALGFELSRGILRGVLRDVTDRKQVEDEADELRRELAHAGRVTMLGQLASALAHELRQPLGAILRNAEAAGIILQKASPDLDELRAIIADIHADDRRAGEVIDRLRALLKRRQMEFQPIALGSLLQDVSALVRFDAAARHVTIDVAIGASLPTVSGDRVHLSQVLINLILNGMDAMAGSSDPRRRVIVEARQGTSRCVEVAVTDSGPGIPPESMTRIFEPFFTTKAGGMGMGLCVSRTIVEAHGGRLWAENNIHGGATFRLELPVAEGTR